MKMMMMKHPPGVGSLGTVGLQVSSIERIIILKANIIPKHIYKSCVKRVKLFTFAIYKLLHVCELKIDYFLDKDGLEKLVHASNLSAFICQYVHMYACSYCN